MFAGGGSHVVDTGGEKRNVTLPVWALTINDEVVFDYAHRCFTRIFPM